MEQENRQAAMTVSDLQLALMQSLAAMGYPARLHDTPESLELDSFDVADLLAELEDRDVLIPDEV